MSSSNIPSRFGPYMIVMVLLTPLFFIGIRDTHDWGDDFAIYLQGAKNLINHHPVSETKYVAFEDYNRSYPPAAVPIGFPIILAPIVKDFGLNFKVLNYYMTLWLYLFAIVCFAFLRRYLSFLSSLGFILIFFLNPFMIELKSEVISDFPFAFFSTTLLLLYTNEEPVNNLFRQILIGVVLAILISIRSIGWCAFLCIGLDLFLRIIAQAIESKKIRETFSFMSKKMLWFVPFIAVYVFLKFIAGNTGSSSFAFYISSYQDIHMWELLMANLNIYLQNFMQLFSHYVGIYGFGLLITQSAMLFCFVLGFIIAILRGYNFLLSYFLFFCFAILLYPFSTQGFRLFLPILPVLILYIAYGARSIVIPSFSKRYIWMPLLSILILLQYRHDLHEMRIHQADPIYPTPISADSKMSFENISKVTTDNDLILSLKPRACALLSDRHYCVIPDGNDPATQSSKLPIAHPTYLLVIKEIDNDRVEALARFEKDQPAYEDAKFKLYRRHL